MPLAGRHCHGVAICRLKVHRIELVEDEPVGVGAYACRDQRILLSHNDERDRPIEYQMAPIHYELAEPGIKLCLLDLPYHVVQHQQNVPM